MSKADALSITASPPAGFRQAPPPPPPLLNYVLLASSVLPLLVSFLCTPWIFSLDSRWTTPPRLAGSVRCFVTHTHKHTPHTHARTRPPPKMADCPRPCEAVCPADAVVFPDSAAPPAQRAAMVEELLGASAGCVPQAMDGVVCVRKCVCVSLRMLYRRTLDLEIDDRFLNLVSSRTGERESNRVHLLRPEPYHTTTAVWDFAALP